MAVPAHLQSLDRRGATRRKLTLQVEGILRRQSTEALIHDISADGMLLQAPGELALGDEIEVQLPEAGATNARVVWSSGGYFGCEFDRPISSASLSAATLRSSARGTGWSHPRHDDWNSERESSEPGAGEIGVREKAVAIVGLSVIAWSVVLLALFLLFRTL